MTMKKVFIKDAKQANDLDEDVLEWLERADAAFILLQIGAREGTGIVTKKEVCNAGSKSNERTKLLRVEEHIAHGLVTYERQPYKNTGSLALTDKGREVCARLKEIYDLMAGEPVSKVLKLTDENGKEYYVREDNLYAGEETESQQKLEEEYMRGRVIVPYAEYASRRVVDFQKELGEYNAYLKDCSISGELPKSRRAWRMLRSKANIGQ